MIDSFGTSVLTKTQLMSSHLYKYLSGDCLILQAIETSPSVPRSWSLQCPLHLILWHYMSDFFFCKKSAGFNASIRRETLHCLGSIMSLVMVNQLQIKINLLSFFFFSNETFISSSAAQKYMCICTCLCVSV